MSKILSNEKIIGDKYRLTVLTPSLIRLEYSEEGNFVDEQTQVVLNRDFPVFEFDVDETPEYLKIHYFDYQEHAKVVSSFGTSDCT